MSYWIKVYGWNAGLRCIVARILGPIFPPAWYIAPAYNRNKWHRIACDDDNCTYCQNYYQELENHLPSGSH